MPILHHDHPKKPSQIFDPIAPALELSGLHYTYPDGHVALRGVSLTIHSGEKVALVGPNGSGKSTLLLNLIGIFQGEGQVNISGVQVVDRNLALIRARVGLVFQNPDDQLFSPTVFEDVAFGPLYMGLPEEEVHTRAKNALEQVGMGAFAERLSHHLSAGEKKRVAIATVLSMQPAVIVLDEPTAGLDPRARRALINLLAGLPQTLLVASHDLHMVAELLPRTLILDDGQIVADGNTRALLSDTALIESHGLERIT